MAEAVVVPTLEELLASPDFQGRYAALKLMEKAKSPSHIPHLRRMLHDFESGLRKGSALLLAELGALEAVPEILAMLEDSWHGCRIGAARALTQLEPRKHLPRILPLLRDPNDRVQSEALRCVVASKDPDMAEHLLPLLEVPLLRIHAAEGICDLSGNRHLSRILPLLQSPDEATVFRTIMLASTHGRDEIEPALVPLIGHKSAEIRSLATKALVHHRPELYSSLLLPWLEEGESRGLSWVDLTIAMRLLAGAQRSDAADLMARHLEHERDEVAGWAALCLGRMHATPSTASIRKLARSKPRERRLAGAIALLRLAPRPIDLQEELLEAVEAWENQNRHCCMRTGAEFRFRQEIIDALLDAHAPALYRKLAEVRTVGREVESLQDLAAEVEAAGIVWTRGSQTGECRGKVAAGEKKSLFQTLEDLAGSKVFAPRGSGVTLIDFDDALSWWRSKLHSEKSP